MILGDIISMPEVNTFYVYLFVMQCMVPTHAMLCGVIFVGCKLICD